MTKTFLIPQIEVDQIKIERAHRTGASKAKDGKNKPRTIMVKFTSFKDRELLLQKARQVKPRGIFVNEDYSSKTHINETQRTDTKDDGPARGRQVCLHFVRQTCRKGSPLTVTCRQGSPLTVTLNVSTIQCILHKHPQ